VLYRTGSHLFRNMAKEKICNQKVMAKIADLLASGQSLVKVCDDPSMPSYRTVTRAVTDDDALWEMYRKARLLQAEYYGDKINDLAQEPLPDTLDAKFMNSEVQRRRLEIDTLKWTLARMQPHGLRDRPGDTANKATSMTLTWGASADPAQLVNGTIIDAVE
jgi:hypothetical protein